MSEFRFKYFYLCEWCGNSRPTPVEEEHLRHLQDCKAYRMNATAEHQEAYEAELRKRIMLRQPISVPGENEPSP